VPGQLIVVQPGDLHDDDFARGVVITGVNLRLAAPGVLPLLLRPGSPRVRPAPTGTAALMERMQQVGAVSDVPAGGLLDALAGQLFWSLAAGIPPAERDPQWVQRGADARFLAQLEQVFRLHAGRRLPVSGMARALGVGPTALTDTCRRLLGRPPAAAHLAWRLERADEVLRASPVTVEAVAAQFGFANAFHFSRAFRRHLGYPPSRAQRGGG
jgi:AraC-like DNA-binding protein